MGNSFYMIICNYELDKFQEKAIYDSHRSILLLAGAGSGKTLTIIGKIKYLIDYKKIDQRRILCLSLTNETVNSLKSKLMDFYHYDLDVFTFHKFSMEIIRRVNKDLLIDNHLLEYIINEYLSNNILNNNYLMRLILEYYHIFYFNIKRSYLKSLSFILKRKEFFKKVITLSLTNNYKMNDLYNILNKRDKKIFIVIYKIYNLYKEEKDATNKIDFNDMLIKATELINLGKVNLPYKYVIIDEYQDTSMVKYQLLKAIVSKTNANLFAVGDDYQEIYSFTGCNLDIFLSFKKCFKDAEILTIPNNYRNPREISLLTNSFILKNKRQLVKNTNNYKEVSLPIKIIYTDNYYYTVKKILKIIGKDYLILGRNNKDIEVFLKDGFRALTIHKAKGLESDNVILVNLSNRIDGFPSKIKNDRIIDKLTSKDDYLYAEERRLFYVALTRTKNNVYILVPRYKQSLFIKELKKDYSLYLEVLKL